MVQSARDPNKSSRYWCNFCGFRSDDAKEYLGHRCTEELRRSESAPPEKGKDRHCR